MDINITVSNHIGEDFSSIDASANEVTIEDVDRVTSALWTAVRNLTRPRINADMIQAGKITISGEEGQ